VISTVKHDLKNLFKFHMKTIAVVVAYIVLVLSSLWCSVFIGTLTGTMQNQKSKKASGSCLRPTQFVLLLLI